MVSPPSVYPVYPVDRVYAVRYHCQNTGRLCGQACVQMLIYSLDQTTLVQQRDWIDRLDDRASGWGTYPTHIQVALQDPVSVPYRPRGLRFILVICNTKARLESWVIHTLRNNRPSPVVLVEGGDHWVLVSGCVLNGAAPSSNTPTTNYSVRRITIHDPATYNDSSTRCWRSHLSEGTLHGADGLPDYCGRGIHDINGCNVHFGDGQSDITKTDWRRRLLPLPSTRNIPSDWRSKYLAVVAVPYGDSERQSG